MSDWDRRVRELLERRAERFRSYDRIPAGLSRRARRSMVATVLVACLVAAGIGYGALSGARALRSPIGPASPNSSPRGQVSPPSPSVSPSGRTFREALGPACQVHEAHGDLNGDRLADVAFSWMPEPADGCPDPTSASLGPLILTLFLSPDGDRVDLRMTDRCDGQNCGYLATADLNDDAKSELAAVTSTGAADDFYRVFGLVDGELMALPVAPPGGDGYPAGAPIELDVGGSVLIQQYVTCETSEAWGGVVLLAHGFSADIDKQGKEKWSHTETAFRFDGRAFTVLYQDPPEAFPAGYDPSRDRSLKARSCWPTLP